MQDIALERGLPANLDAERFVLGSILMDDSSFIPIAGTLQADDFSLEKNRRIFSRMAFANRSYRSIALLPALLHCQGSC